jgi:hypothetical protein
MKTYSTIRRRAGLVLAIHAVYRRAPISNWHGRPVMTNSARY